MMELFVTSEFERLNAARTRAGELLLTREQVSADCSTWTKIGPTGIAIADPEKGERYVLWFKNLAISKSTEGELL